MKVYVVTRGGYSDYHICGVTLDKELADKMAEHLRTPYDNTYVEEFDTDKWLGYDMELGYFEVCLCDSGVITVVETDSIFREYFEPNKVTLSARQYYVEVRAVDKDHALKIATECIARFKAEEEGLL